VTDIFCSRCKNIYVCSKECLKNSWNRHKYLCIPVDLNFVPLYGLERWETERQKFMNDSNLLVNSTVSDIDREDESDDEVFFNVTREQCKLGSMLEFSEPVSLEFMIKVLLSTWENTSKVD